MKSDGEQMIKGIGIDTVFMDRIERASQSTRFIEKCFSAAEIELFKQRGKCIQFLAGNFAAKEAVAKALGVGFVGFAPKDIEVLRDGAGKPYINLLGNAKKNAKDEAVFHVSITNTVELASAVVVIEG